MQNKIINKKFSPISFLYQNICVQRFISIAFFTLFFSVVFVPNGYAQNSEVDEIKNIVKNENLVEAKDIFTESKNKILRWKLAHNEHLEVKKDSDQFILLNGRKIHRQVIHRVLLSVQDVSSSQGYRLAGMFRSAFRYYLKNKNPYQEEDRFYGNFYLTPRGNMIMDKTTYMPNVRSMPTFPLKEDPSIADSMPEGFSWNAPGEEVVQSNGKLIHIPLDVMYEYHGKTVVQKNGVQKNMHKIFMNYQIDYKNATKYPGEIQSMYGYASVHMLWDEEEGIPYMASEVYDIMIGYGDGQFHEFRIKARSHYRKIKPMSSKEKTVLQNSLQDRLAKYKTTGPQAEIDIRKKGVSVQLPNILFDYNSNKLTEKSKQILREIIPVLEQHADRYFVIRGHTDNVGSSVYNEKLSAERAKAVTSFMMDNSNIPADHFSYEGLGFREPIAGNHTEAGRAQNRRVEIFIPEK